MPEYGDAPGLDVVDDDYYDRDDDSDDVCNARKFHGDARGVHDVDGDYDDYDDQGFSGMTFHGVNKNYERVCNHWHYTDKYRETTHSICNLRCKMPKEILTVVFNNRSNYEYHFIIKQVAEESEGQFECLGENTEKCISFSVPVEKQENGKSMKYKIRFIDSVRFMPSYQ